jgi:UDP:flavonoid glycosyltransferase YjiC (YdhE family)
MAESVTLAHLARPLVLAQAAIAAGHSVVIARAPSYAWLTARYPMATADLASISQAEFAAALAAGRPLYTAGILERYIKDDLAMFGQVQPDVVVGDFRLSLSVSARLAKIPYATITNAYWSPYADPDYTVPSLPLTRFLPIGLANALFLAARPLAFRLHTLPMNGVRRRHGLPGLGSDLRRTYTDADLVLYADVPDLFPLSGAPANHQFLGPILWAPPVDKPSWWDTLPPGRPVVYATPGSSGHSNLLPTVVAALAGLQVSVIAATAGQPRAGLQADNVFLADYLPGMDAAARSRLVICNGGSPTCQQALAAGVPVLGIPTNLDQFLNMAPIVESRAGRLVRADRVTPEAIRAQAESLLDDPGAHASANRIADDFRGYDAGLRFVTALNAL